eukprot:scaffold280778_cov21-Tisochrysis_lutea.AAC.1
MATSCFAPCRIQRTICWWCCVVLPVGFLSETQLLLLHVPPHPAVIPALHPLPLCASLPPPFETAHPAS